MLFVKVPQHLILASGSELRKCNRAASEHINVSHRREYGQCNAMHIRHSYMYDPEKEKKHDAGQALQYNRTLS
jgi:hypothetical protein